ASAGSFQQQPLHRSLRQRPVELLRKPSSKAEQTRLERANADRCTIRKVSATCDLRFEDKAANRRIDGRHNRFFAARTARPPPLLGRARSAKAAVAETS